MDSSAYYKNFGSMSVTDLTIQNMNEVVNEFKKILNYSDDINIDYFREPERMTSFGKGKYRLPHNIFGNNPIPINEMPKQLQDRNVMELQLFSERQGDQRAPPKCLSAVYTLDTFQQDLDYGGVNREAIKSNRGFYGVIIFVAIVLVLAVALVVAYFILK